VDFERCAKSRSGRFRSNSTALEPRAVYPRGRQLRRREFVTLLGSAIYIGTGCAAPHSLLAALETMEPGLQPLWARSAHVMTFGAVTLDWLGHWRSPSTINCTEDDQPEIPTGYQHHSMRLPGRVSWHKRVSRLDGEQFCGFQEQILPVPSSGSNGWANAGVAMTITMSHRTCRSVRYWPKADMRCCTASPLSGVKRT